MNAGRTILNCPKLLLSTSGTTTNMKTVFGGLFRCVRCVHDGFSRLWLKRSNNNEERTTEDALIARPTERRKGALRLGERERDRLWLDQREKGESAAGNESVPVLLDASFKSCLYIRHRNILPPPSHKLVSEAASPPRSIVRDTASDIAGVSVLVSCT